MQMTITNVNHDAKLVAHLLRRAAFGSTPAEFDRAVEQGFDKTSSRSPTPRVPHSEFTCQGYIESVSN